MGGPHVTALPDEAAHHLDAIVLGEGELSWPRVVQDLVNGTHSAVDCRGRSFDLRMAPMPRFDLLQMGRYARVTGQTQRGCPFDCEFCAASMRMVPAFKVKPVEKVVAEMIDLRGSQRARAPSSLFNLSTRKSMNTRTLAGTSLVWVSA